ncbi:MAG: hypothetical protein HYR96_11290, partial [Deltaproteobacteria bacterium]|nr:hypothetical protein [Deltaproteobacteria bacterium]
MRRWPVFVAVLLFTLAARAEMLSYELGVEHEVNPRQSYSFGFGSSSLSSGGTMHELMLERKTKFYEFGANSDLSYLLGIGYMLWNDSGGPELKTGLEWNWRAINWLGFFSRIQLHVAYQ